MIDYGLLLKVTREKHTQDVLSHHHMAYVLDSKRPNYDFPLTTLVVSIIYSSLFKIKT
jgi:hypothetical protein